MTTTQAEAHDIHSFKDVEVRELRADDPDLPPFIRIVEADNYRDAVAQMVLAAYESPISTPVWLGAAKLVDKETMDYVHRMRTFLCMESLPPLSNRALKNIFKTHANIFKKRYFGVPFQNGHYKFFGHMKSLSEALHSNFSNPDFRINFRPNASYSTSPQSLHLDNLNLNIGPSRSNPLANSIKVIKDIRERPTHVFRFLQTWTGGGSVIANPEDWVLANHFSVTDFSDAVKSGKKPVVYEVPPLALALITQAPWFHTPSLHGRALPSANDPDGPANKRLLVYTDLEISPLI